MATDRPAIGFIGAGRVARSLAPALVSAGYRVAAVASRTTASAEGLAALLPGAVAASPQEVVTATDVVFITTPDDEISTVTAAIRWSESKSVVHTSGARSHDALAPAARQGAATGGFHPLQTFAGDAQVPLAGVTFAIDADSPLKEALREMVAALGGHVIDVDGEARPLYHAAAVMVSNYTVTLVELAAAIWSRLGFDRDTALQALLPLLEGTVANLKAEGLPFALTGPISRGDVTTVRANLGALSREDPRISAVYRCLGAATIPIAVEKGGISEAMAVDLLRLLGDGSKESACLERKTPS